MQTSNGMQESQADCTQVAQEQPQADVWCPSCGKWHTHDCGKRLSDLRAALKRLHDWILIELEDCMFSADHPVARAAAVLSSEYWIQSDAFLAECKDVIAKFDAAKAGGANE